MKKVFGLDPLMVAFWTFIAAMLAMPLWSIITIPPQTPGQRAASAEWERQRELRREAEREQYEAEGDLHREKCEFLRDRKWWDAGVRDIRRGDVIVDPKTWEALWFEDKERLLKQIADCDHGIWGLTVIDGKTGNELASWGPVFGLDVE